MAKNTPITSAVHYRQRIHDATKLIESFCLRHPVLSIVSVVFVCAAIIFLRRPDAITQAQFWAEDGAVWYATAYRHGLGSIFMTYAGYFGTVYRIVAATALTLPFSSVAIFFNIVALCFQLLPVLMLCGGRLPFIKYRSLGILLSLIYVCVPNSAEVFSNFSNIQWHLTFLVLLIILAKPSERLTWKIFDYSALILTGLSSPVAIMISPILLWLYWRHRTPRYRNLLFVAFCLAAIQLLYILFLSHYERVGISHPNIHYFIEMLTGQVFIGGLLGQNSVNILYKDPPALLAVFTLCAGIITYVFIKGPEWLKLCIAYSGILIVAMLASLKPVAGFDPWQGLTNPTGGQRYWYIPILIWIGVLMWMALRGPAKVARVIGTVGMLILIIGIVQDWRITPKTDRNFQYYVTQFEKAPSGTKIKIPTNPEGWYVNLIKK